MGPIVIDLLSVRFQSRFDSSIIKADNLNEMNHFQRIFAVTRSFSEIFSEPILLKLVKFGIDFQRILAVTRSFSEIFSGPILLSLGSPFREFLR